MPARKKPQDNSDDSIWRAVTNKKAAPHPKKRRRGCEFFPYKGKYLPVNTPRRLAKWITEEIAVVTSHDYPVKQKGEYLRALCLSVREYGTRLRESYSGLSPLPRLREGQELFWLHEVIDWCASPRDVSDARTESDGAPFYKPSYFTKWNIGDELLRRNSTDQPAFVEGKVRRDNKQTCKGKKPVYWYSEPDAKRCWPHRFAENPGQFPKKTTKS